MDFLLKFLSIEPQFELPSHVQKRYIETQEEFYSY